MCFEQRKDNLRNSLNTLALALILVALVLLSASVLLSTLRRIGFAGALFALAVYLPWGLVHEYALNGYFLLRSIGSQCVGLRAHNPKASI